MKRLISCKQMNMKFGCGDRMPRVVISDGYNKLELVTSNDTIEWLRRAKTYYEILYVEGCSNEKDF